MKRLLLLLFLNVSLWGMHTKQPIKTVFITQELETTVREFLNKNKKEELTRAEYLSYLITKNREMAQEAVFIVRFLATFRGCAYETLKDK